MFVVKPSEPCVERFSALDVKVYTAEGVMRLYTALRATETHAADMERVTMPDTGELVFDDKGSILGYYE